MTKIPLLRSWLCENGFSITCEKIVCEGRFFYTVMKAVYDGNIHSLSEFEHEMGIADWNDETVRSYGRFRYSQLKKVCMNLEKADLNTACSYKNIMQEIALRCKDLE